MPRCPRTLLGPTGNCGTDPTARKTLLVGFSDDAYQTRCALSERNVVCWRVRGVHTPRSTLPTHLL